MALATSFDVAKIRHAAPEVSVYGSVKIAMFITLTMITSGGA